MVDLRRLVSRDLDSLLSEETARWRNELAWDFEKSASLVRRFIDLRALHGSALVEDGQVTGYVYYVLEENKGLIGDLYVRSAWESVDRENLLLDAALGAIIESRYAVRVECQLMMLRRDPARVLPYPGCLSTFERNFMRIDLDTAVLRESSVRHPVFIERWSDHYQDGAAQVIADAYSGHIDASINDQYRSAAGARRFLYNIVQYPGCGTFYRPASFAAFDAGGHLCGLSLASLVAADCGHITQICVAPEIQGTGVGYELLRQSLNALRSSRCRSASLTVTSANTSAVALYEHVGFHTTTRFSAYVWEGFRA
jgi:ribosomal protein S18 acetylase RimI-like enzyme